MEKNFTNYVCKSCNRLTIKNNCTSCGGEAIEFKAKHIQTLVGGEKRKRNNN